MDVVFKKLLIGLTAFCVSPVWGDNLVSSREGRLLGGLHGGSYGVKYSTHSYYVNGVDLAPESKFFGKTIGALGGGIHIGGDWSSSGGVYLAAMLGYDFTKMSKTENGKVLAPGATMDLSQSMKRNCFFDLNIGGGHTTCLYLILGYTWINEKLSYKIKGPGGTALLNSELSTALPHFGLGTRFMLADNVVLSVSSTVWAASHLWEKRKVTESIGGHSEELSQEDKEEMDKDRSASVAAGYRFTIGVSYALPVRSIFG
jgi:hypothetical protein